MIEIGLQWLQIAPKKSKNATMEFWKLLCLFYPYNRTQRQLTTSGTSGS